MMANYIENYIESFRIDGREYGIEDFKSPGKHFFDGRDSNGKPRPRYMLWVGGGGFGHADTLQQARQRMHAYAIARLSDEIVSIKASLKSKERALTKLADDEANLLRFKK